VDVPLVIIPVQVNDARGASVRGLDRQDFQLFEDGAEQRITHFSREDAPLSVGFLLDSSSSMKNKMRRAVEAGAEFLRVSNREDEFFVVQFGERPKLAVPLTRDIERVRSGILGARPIGRTSLLDAIEMSLAQMKRVHNTRKAVIILSDGGDNHSRATEAEIKKAVREADVQIYSVGIFDRNESPKRPPEERDGPSLLADLARDTGGKDFSVAALDDLPGICARIGAELREQYLLGYSPANTAVDGKYRHVRVVVRAPGGSQTAVRHRAGYYAPAK
jgi:Ca-activated chloride channel family protein